MKPVNFFYVTEALMPLAGGADLDDEIERYRDFDSNDEAAVRTVIRTRIIPYLKSTDEGTQEWFRHSLEYYLASKDVDFGSLFSAYLVAIYPPDDARCFFVWIWEELTGRKYEPVDLAAYQETDKLPRPKVKLVQPYP